MLFSLFEAHLIQQHIVVYKKQLFVVEQTDSFANSFTSYHSNVEYAIYVFPTSPI